jgi:pyrimidine operon attenuation protein / uracil phosphoribosyltransferase
LPTRAELDQVLHAPEQYYVRLERALAALLAERAIQRPLFVGIHSGGYQLAQRLHHALKIAEPLGGLNISFYRDDFAQSGLSTEQASSLLPVDVDARSVVLIDDILYTGRTIRAAINQLFDFGRPAHVLLACLIARDGRELPLQADAVGAVLTMSPKQVIKLTQVDPIKLSLQERRG